MTVEREAVPVTTPARTAGPAPPVAGVAAGEAALLLGLQQTIGNRAVARLRQRCADGAAPPVADPPADTPPPASDPPPPTTDKPDKPPRRRRRRHHHRGDRPPPLPSDGPDTSPPPLPADEPGPRRHRRQIKDDDKPFEGMERIPPGGDEDLETEPIEPARRDELVMMERVQPEEAAAPAAAAPRRFAIPSLGMLDLASWLEEIVGVTSATGTGLGLAAATFEVSVGKGISDLLDVSGGLALRLEGRMSVADDRRFRAQASLAVGVFGNIQLQVLSARLQGNLSIALSGTYQDARHFAARLLGAIERACGALKGVIRSIAGQKREQLDEAHERELGDLGPKAAPSPVSGSYEKLKKEKAQTKTEKIGLDAVGRGQMTGVGGLAVTGAVEWSRFTKRDKGKKITKVGRKTTRTVTVDVPLGVFSCRMMVEERVVENDSTPENNGHFVFLRLTPGAAVPLFNQATLTTLATQIVSGVGAVTIDDFAQAAKGLLRTLVKAPLLLSGVIPGVTNVLTGEIGFVRGVEDTSGEERYAMIYARMLEETGLRVDMPKVTIPTPVGVDVGLKAGVELKQVSALGEALGTTTLRYLRQLYGGLVNREDRGLAQWEAWRSSHRPTLVEVLRSIGTPGTQAQIEVIELSGQDLGSIAAAQDARKAGWNAEKQAAQQLAPDCMAAFRGVAEGAEPPEVNRLLAALDSYLEVKRLHEKALAAKTWRVKGGGRLVVEVRGTRSGTPEVHVVKHAPPDSDKRAHAPPTLADAYGAGYKIEVRIPVTPKKTITASFTGPADKPAEKINEAIRSKYKRESDYPAALSALIAPPVGDADDDDAPPPGLAERLLGVPIQDDTRL